MNAKTVYEAYGRNFDKPEDAQKHERYCAMLERARNLLRQPIDSTTNFVNGGGYVQQSAEAVSAFIELTGRAIAEFEPFCLSLWNANPRGFVGRYLDDGNSPAYQNWGLLQRMDSRNRLWGQAYYANNPQANATEWPDVKEP